jgi:hypothetical protein
MTCAAVDVVMVGGAVDRVVIVAAVDVVVAPVALDQVVAVIPVDEIPGGSAVDVVVKIVSANCRHRCLCSMVFLVLPSTDGATGGPISRHSLIRRRYAMHRADCGRPE